MNDHLNWIFLLRFSSAIGRGTILLLMIAATTLALRRASASTRHMLWALGLCGLVLLPFLTEWLPSLNAPLPPRFTAVFVRRPARDESALDTLRRETPLSRAARNWGGWPDVPLTSTPVIILGSPQQSMALARGPHQRPSPIPLIFVAVWLVGAVVVLARTTVGLWGLTRLRSACVEVTGGPLARSLSSVASDLGYRRRVRLLLAGAGLPGLPPMTWGLRRPVILLPSGSDEWPADRVRATLLHELAHVRRHDFLWQMVSAISCAMYWCHPLVWWAAERMRVESEKACDDSALTHGMRAADYAGLLLDVARSMRCAASPVAVALTMVRRPRIEGRLLAVLAKGVPRNPATRRAGSAIMVVASVLLAPLAAFEPILRLTHSAPPARPREGVVTALNGRAKLDNGVTVELAGVADNGLRRQAWWSAKGDPLSAAPYPSRGWHSEGGKEREIGLRVTYPAAIQPVTRAESVRGTDATVVTEVNRSAGAVTETEVDRSIAPPLPAEVHGGFRSEWRAISGRFECRQQRTDLLYGVAAGPWRTVASAKSTLGTVRTANGDVTFLREWETLDREAVPAKDSTQASPVQYRTVRHSVLSVIDGEGDVDRRVVAVNRHGRETPTSTIETGYIGSRVRTTVELNTESYLKDSLLKDVRELRLQVRPFRWARFADIALDPKGGIPPQPAAAPPAEVRAVYYLCVDVTPTDPSLTNDLADDALMGDERSAAFQRTLADGPSAYLAALRRSYPAFRFAQITTGVARPDAAGQIGLRFSTPPRDVGSGLRMLGMRTDVQLNVDQSQQVNGSVTLLSAIDEMAEDDSATGRPRQTVVLGWQISRTAPGHPETNHSNGKVAHVLLGHGNVLDAYGDQMLPGDSSQLIIVCPVS